MTHLHEAVHHADVVDRDADLGVVEASPGPEVEGVPVHRRTHEPDLAPAPDDPPGDARSSFERIVVAERMHLVVGGTKKRDRLAMDQCGRATFGLEIIQPADRLPLLVGPVATHGATLVAVRFHRSRPV